MKLSYNSPVILTFAIVAISVFLTDRFLFSTMGYFSLPPHFNFTSPIAYFRLFSHIAGHGSWPHLFGNFALILLIGPIVEEKYGAKKLLFMMMVTALVTSILNILIFSSGVLGASGIAFMLIILGSLTNFKAKEIPLTFILIIVLYIGKEVINSFTPDNISQFSHIVGGVTGAVFGLKFGKK